MNNFLQNIKSVLEEIQLDETIQVIHANYFEGISLEEINQIESKLKIKLPEVLKDFYQVSNGLQLSWIYKNNPDYNSKLHKFTDSPHDWNWISSDYHPFDGVIQLLPLHNTFSNSWENKIWFKSQEKYETTFQGKKLNLMQFSKRIKPFDTFSRYYNTAFYLEEISNQLLILLGQDHGADFHSSKILTVEEYFDLLIETKGLIDTRVKRMKDEWGSLN